ncbi:MAG: hypothetical protein ACRC7N_17700 [Clostridium sp.]
MEKTIDGKVYKEIGVSKVVVNGEAQEGNVISSTKASEGQINITVVTNKKSDE